MKLNWSWSHRALTKVPLASQLITLPSTNFNICKSFINTSTINNQRTSFLVLNSISITIFHYPEFYFINYFSLASSRIDAWLPYKHNSALADNIVSKQRIWTSGIRLNWNALAKNWNLNLSCLIFWISPICENNLIVDPIQEENTVYIIGAKKWYSFKSLDLDRDNQ